MKSGARLAVSLSISKRNPFRTGTDGDSTWPGTWRGWRRTKHDNKSIPRPVND